MFNTRKIKGWKDCVVCVIIIDFHFLHGSVWIGNACCGPRTKEIGIRKVLGANVSSIVMLLSNDFVWLICIASIIAFPIAWWALNNWLTNFSYRINIQWWVFLIAGIAALMIALITVSFQAIKAALTNPVKSLRQNKL
jgi:ABC-type antimicrobial peptide transport system permease subunit